MMSVSNRSVKNKLAELSASHRTHRICQRMDPIIKALKKNKPNEVILTCVELGAFFWNSDPDYFNDFPDYKNQELPPLDILVTLLMAELIMRKEMLELDIPENMFVMDVLSKGINTFTILMGRVRVELILNDLEVAEIEIIKVRQVLNKFFPYPLHNSLMAQTFIDIMDRDCIERQKYLLSIMQNESKSEVTKAYNAAEKLHKLFNFDESNFVKILEHAKDQYETKRIKQDLLSNSDEELKKFCDRLDYYFGYLKKNMLAVNLGFSPTMSSLLQKKYKKSDEKKPVTVAQAGLFCTNDPLIMISINEIVFLLKNRIEFFSAPFLNQTKFADWALSHEEIVNLSSDLMGALTSDVKEKISPLLQFQEAILGENGKNDGLMNGHEERIRNLLLTNSALRAALQQNKMPHKSIEAWYQDNKVKACNAL